MLDHFENNYATYTIVEGILNIRYHIGVFINLSAAVEIVKDRLVLQQGQSYPALCDMRGVREVNKSARDYFAMEGSVLLKAVAFVVEPPVSDAISKFYLFANKPPIPTKAFYTIENAENFLIDYC
ncbi:DUF7793 family protein [Aequorivita antarctica]|uniref:DUF7793 domain-containing protein n=1 Tax=Aequorivita antarctica TaxID=153266 RepID=A0A5C6YZW5_9FLAO|nr:hypothetical protein [Aequorivita antarctica]TXD73313.1 hypothetical protein ESU54_09260 [Aequorivita antarctica]SRX74736.1 hypothetical protein AEQU3_01716 [Aequorivita antarctica]